MCYVCVCVLETFVYWKLLVKTAGTKIENFGFMHHFRMSILSMFHDSKGRLVVVLCDLPCFYSKNQQINPIFWSNMTLKFSKSAQNLSQTPTPLPNRISDVQVLRQETVAT